ncbi:gas vesicle synthesis GvpLF [Sphaerisporangium album]|uniref:Gas vesicle synthesis GvpLF n=1 Tax=Sphaerisporangium album TaxID=509200 RepID=A0A367FHD3_9ACTN|nr:GvpL/GvpF family gas vesicle protein [Sphaerisporangium album]RCG29731.1 gas vesicle synthesis GvpLF [Sphaerisporangium album]
MADSATYLYAITREKDRADPERLAGVAGVAGAPVRAVPQAGLVAYVSTVPLAEFGEEPLRRSLEDLDWVGETARAHHRVVETVAMDAATAPVRLVTVYSGDAQVRAMLERRHEDLATVLAQVAGRREWGVKVYAHPARPASPVGARAPESPEASGAGPGTAYLRRRKASLRGRDEAWREAAERAEHIHEALADVAVATRRHRAQDPRLSGRDEWMLLNGAYLVDEDRRGEFAAAVEGLREPGIDVEITGPWAPYSFTALEFAAPEDRDGG